MKERRRQQSGENVVPMSAAEYPNVVRRRQGKSGPVAPLVPYKQDVITKVSAVGAAMVICCLTVVLWREQPNRTSRHVVGVGNLERTSASIIIQHRPRDHAYLCCTGRSIETFDANL